jgi:hypothetical protein
VEATAVTLHLVHLQQPLAAVVVHGVAEIHLLQVTMAEVAAEVLVALMVAVMVIQAEAVEVQVQVLTAVILLAVLHIMKV